MKALTFNLYREIKSFGQKVTENKLAVYSACTAFYLFVSFIPFLMIIVAIIPFLPITQEDITSFFMDFIPNNYSYIVNELIDDLYFHNTAALSVSIIAIIWSSGRGVLGITQGLNEIAKVKESRNFVYMRIRSALYTIALAGGMILMVVVAVFGNTIINIINNTLGVPESILDILEYKHLLVFIILFALFVFFFVALPNKKMKIKEQFWGALIASFIWCVFSYLFDVWLSAFDSYSMYGSFAVVIVLGVWLYTGMYIMFMGAQFNEYLASKKGNKYEGQN